MADGPHGKELKMDTMVVHAGQRPEETTGAVMPPIFTSSFFMAQLL